MDSLVERTVCAICFESMEPPPSPRTPKTMACANHCFCMSCMADLCMRAKAKTGKTSGDVSLSCPMCNQLTVVPNGDVDKLPTNIIVVSIIEALAKEKKEKKEKKKDDRRKSKRKKERKKSTDVAHTETEKKETKESTDVPCTDSEKKETRKSLDATRTSCDKKERHERERRSRRSKDESRPISTNGSPTPQTYTNCIKTSTSQYELRRTFVSLPIDWTETKDVNGNTCYLHKKCKLCINTKPIDELYIALSTSAPFNNRANEAKMLNFKEGDQVRVYYKTTDDWFEGLCNGNYGAVYARNLRRVLPLNWERVEGADFYVFHHSIADCICTSFPWDDVYIALFDYEPSEPGYLAFKMGEMIRIYEYVEGWGRAIVGKRHGLVPMNFLVVEELYKEVVELAKRFDIPRFRVAEVRRLTGSVEKTIALLNHESKTKK